MTRGSLLALIVAAALAAAGCGGDDEADTAEKPATTPTETGEQRTTTQETETETGTGTETGPTITEKADPKQAEVSLAVFRLVAAVETGEAAEVCKALGQRAAGPGAVGIKACSDRAGVDVDRLPSSDELSTESVKATGDRAVVRLSSGGTIRLRRSGEEWRVVAYSAPRLGQP